MSWQITCGALVAFVSLFALAWREWVRRDNRRRARVILHWVESTLGTPMGLAACEWSSPSMFRVPLVTPPGSVYRRGSIRVVLAPREKLHRWMMFHLRKNEEQVTFAADLVQHPRGELTLGTIRFVADTSRGKVEFSSPWVTEKMTPLLLTTSRDFPRETQAVLAALLQLEQKYFAHLKLSSQSPHYEVTLPLSMIAPDCAQRLEMATAIRELAVEASSCRD